MSDLENIIKGCKKGSITHQKALYTLFEKKIYNVSLKYCTSKEEAEDNLQDTFIEIFSKIQTFKKKGSFEGWMKRIAINKAISKFKLDIKTKGIEDFIYPIKDETITIEPNSVELSILLKLIQELPNQYRLVFNMYELDDYSHKEISKLLSISEGTSKSNLYKAKAILKKKILEIKKKKVRYGF